MASETFQVLLIEDDDVDAAIVQRALDRASDSYSIIRVSRLSEATESFGSFVPDLILLDLGLPDSVGIQNVLKLREVNLDTPIIVLTGWDDVFAGKLLSAGAQQFFSKNYISGGGLAQTVRNTILLARANDDRVAKQPANDLQPEIEELQDAVAILQEVHLGPLEQLALEKVLHYFEERWQAQ